MSGFVQDWLQSEEMRRIKSEVAQGVSGRWNILNERYGISLRVANVQNWIQAHPMVSMFILATLFICALPLLCLITAVVCSVFIFITGFLLFEGTVLTVFIIICGTVLFFGAFLAFGFTGCLVAVCLGTQGVMKLLEAACRKMQSPPRFFPENKID